MPVGVQCTISSSLGEFPSYWDWLYMLSWVFARIGVHHPSLRFPYLVFSVCSYLPLDFNRVSSLRTTYRHPVGRPFTYFLGEFPSLGLALVPDVVVPEAERRCAWSRKLNPSFCPGRGRTSDLGI